MTLLALCQAIQDSSFATVIAESDWMFPTIETVHVIALTLVVGSIAMLDLRILGVTTRTLHVMQLSEEVLPWTWGAFTRRTQTIESGAYLIASGGT